VNGYNGAIVIAPEDQAELQAALRRVAEMRGQKFEHPYSWADTAACFDELFAMLPAPDTEIKVPA